MNQQQVIAVEEMPAVLEALAGATGGSVSLAMIYPLDTLKTRLQVEKSPNLTKLYQDIRELEGIRGFYSGLGAALLGVFSTNFAYFYWYSALKYFFKGRSRISVELLLGMAAGALAQICTIPVSVVVTRQQTQDFKSKKREGVYETWCRIIREDGWTGLWKGLKPSLVLVVNPAITYAVVRQLESWIEPRNRTSTGNVFMVAAVAKSIATVITYPYIIAKVQMQAMSNSAWLKESGSEKVSAAGLLRHLWKQEGVLGWYKGLTAQILKAMLAQALLLLVKHRITWLFMIFLRRRGRRS